MSLNNKLDNIAEPLQFLGQWLLRAPLGVVMIIHGLGKFP
ncbi:MAG: DoxX family protein, partial [Alphaproteobacteria bacterium]|nr:DoxX family protein [Alphaproteobacteria bacterium]